MLTQVESGFISIEKSMTLTRGAPLTVIYLLRNQSAQRIIRCPLGAELGGVSRSFCLCSFPRRLKSTHPQPPGPWGHRPYLRSPGQAGPPLCFV